MRKTQKKEILGLIDSMHQVHEEIKKALEQNNLILAQDMISGAQESAISFGGTIEKIEGEGHVTVSCIEEYCEFLFGVFEDIDKKNFNVNKVYKLLRKQLIKIENSVKNDIAVRQEVAFFPYKASMWDSLESIYLAAKADPDCDAYCVPIPYYTLNSDQSFGEMHYEGNEYPEDIEITDWQEYDFEKRKPDVVYIHNPYDNCNLVTSVHPRFYSFNLKKYTNCLVYVPYYVTSGGMLEVQGSLPSYQYVDYIVIQAPQFRQYFDESIPDGKFLPFGSPKVDRVIKKCKNPPEPPMNWQEKMSGKKVYFYNTSIGGMLADTENFLIKMQYVFDCFKGRNDVCILWRPHPLLETTFHSMRPQYEQDFEQLKTWFVENDIGIIDTTADIEDSIALSDAYIGDAGTSVTALFAAAGKPIFILNNKMHSEPEEDSWRGEIINGFNYFDSNQCHLMITQRNKLYISERNQYDYHYFCDLPDCMEGVGYFGVYEIGDKKYACPAYEQNILVLGQEGIEKKIELDKRTEGVRAFDMAWSYDKYLLLVPINYPAIVCYNTDTGEIRYFTENINAFVRTVNGEMAQGASLVYKGALYIASPMDSTIYKLDIESGETQVVELPIQSRCGCSVLSSYHDELWLMPYEGRVIVRWNPDTGQTWEYAKMPENFFCQEPITGIKCEKWPFNIPAFYKEYVYLTPAYANMYLKLNMDTGEFELWKLPFETREKNEYFYTTGKSTFFNHGLYDSAAVYKLYYYPERKLYNFNFETGTYSEIKINFDIRELQDREVGFGKYSEKLKYVCIESVFNSLGNFLNGNIAGNQFDEDKQLETMREIMANQDGSCGAKIHESIMKGTNNNLK